MEIVLWMPQHVGCLQLTLRSLVSGKNFCALKVEAALSSLISYPRFLTHKNVL